MLKNLKKILIILLLLTPGLTYSQQWAAKFSSPSRNDIIASSKSYAITTSKSNFVYITGYVTGDSTGTDICTIKYDPEGNILWARFYNGTGNSEDKAYAIIVDDQDNVYVTGYSTGIASGKDITVLKYSSEGDLLANYIHPTAANGDDKAYAICMDESGNIYLTGDKTSLNGDKNIVVLKLGSGLTKLWDYSYNRNGYDDIPLAITLDHSGHVFVTGSSFSGESPSSEDMVTIKLSCLYGNSYSSWTRVYNGTGNESDKAYAIVVDDYDNIIITGYSTTAAGTLDITTVKYNQYGYQLWVSTYDRGFEDVAQSIAMASGNIVVVTGYSSTAAIAGSEDYITIGYDGLSGQQLWDKPYDGTGDNTDISYSMVFSELDNSIYITGSSKTSTEPGTEDMVTIKYDAVTGDILDSLRYNDESNGEDVAYDIALDTLGNVYITGYIAPGGDMAKPSDMMTLKYTNGHLVSRNSNVTPGSFKLYQNYPNPFNPTTSIKFQIPSNGITKIVVYDINGRQVDVLADQYMKSGDYSINFNGNKLSSGVYFVQLTFGSLKDVMKMVLVK